MLRPARIFTRETRRAPCRRRRRNGAQQAVDAQPHPQRAAERLDVDVGRAQLDGALEQLIDGAHHRRAARHVAQDVEVVVIAALRQLGDVFDRCSVLLGLTAAGVAQQRLDLVESRDLAHGLRPSVSSIVRSVAGSDGSATAR